MRNKPSAYSQGVEMRAASSVRAGCWGTQGSQMVGGTMMTGHADLGVNPITVTLDDSMDWRGRLVIIFAGLDPNEGDTPFSSPVVTISPLTYDVTFIDSYTPAFLYGQFLYTGRGWDEVGIERNFCPMRELIGTTYRYTSDFLFFANATTGVLRFAQRRRPPAIPGKTPNFGLTYTLIASEPQGASVTYP